MQKLMHLIQWIVQISFATPSRCDVRLDYCGTDDLVTFDLGWFIY